jgi:PAS domain S-box-containing protein
MATILIIEDRPVDRKLLTMVLRSAGYEVIGTSDGEEALETMQRRSVDLVVSDILMPTVDGYEFVRRLRQMSVLAHVPVIFYTATYHEREARALAERCGVAAILTKPSRPDVILKTVQRVLEQERRAVPQPDPADFAREHLQVVSTTLAHKIDEVEAGKQRIAALVDFAQQIATARDSDALLQQVCVAARDVTLAQHAVVAILTDEGHVNELFTSGMTADVAGGLSHPPPDARLVRQVLQEGRPFRERNPGGRPEVFGLASDHAPVHSILAVPITSPTRVYGWLSVRNKLGADEFSEADEEVAVALGAHTAVAYENARLYEDLQRHVAALEQEVADRRRVEQALRHRTRLATFSSAIGTALTTTRTISEMLQACVDAVAQHLEAAAARIWLVTDAGDALDLRASAGSSAPPPNEPRLLRIGERAVGDAARQHRAYVTNAASSAPEVGDTSWLRRERIVSFAAYPLVVDVRLVGVLAIYARAAWTDETLDALASASGEIALGIERRQVDAQIRENEERTRFALNTVRMGIWEFDPLRNDLRFSETLGPVFGFAPEASPSDVLAYVERVHQDDRAMLAQQAERVMTTGREGAAELRAIWPDDSVHWIDIRARPLIDESGKVVRILGVCIDVSARKLLEEQFLHAQKMEGIGQLAGGVAHDFNNLLTAILGYAALLGDSLALDDPRRQDLDEIVKATDRATALTRQLLAFSRKQVLEPTIINLNTLIRDMSQMVSRLIGEDVHLVPVLAPDLASVRADPGQIHQVIMNLAVNARDAMPSGGRLSIETSNVDLDGAYLLDHAVARPGAYVMLAVTDTGIGMSDQVRTRLFEPFFTTKEKGRGTGLGLATVYGIVQQSGGYIWVYSEPGQGTTFKVYLPAVDAERPDASQATAPAAAQHGTETILLVEDEEAVRRLASVMLRRVGYQVIEAANPADAIAILEERRSVIAMLITDVVMPGSSGPALYERLLAHRPELKVLYMSGYTDDSVIRQGRLQPGAAFLQKPFTGEGLLRKVREVLDQ